MNIFNYFSKLGIDTVDTSFYRKIDEWKSWYEGNVKGFQFYRVYTGQGETQRRRRKTMGMAKKVCEDIADLMLNEHVQIIVDDERTGQFVDQILEENRFRVLGNEYQERKAYTGTVAFVPYLYDMDVSEDGSVRSAKIGIDYVSGENIYPITWKNGMVTETAFTFPKTVNRKKYVHVQIHRLMEQGYVITNSVLESRTGSQDGTELRPEEWRQLKPFQGLAPTVITGSMEPQFVLDRLNLVNNVGTDTYNPMGIALFANAIDILKKLDIEYDSYCTEFELGRKRVFVSPTLMKNRNGNPAFDPEDVLFYSLPEDYSGGGEDKDRLIHEINMELRTEEHRTAINDDLNYLSARVGFGTDYYEFNHVGVQAKTATEVVSENGDLYRTIRKHEIILEDVLKQLVKIIIRLGITAGNPLKPEAKITINFDDSIIEDKTAERRQDQADVAMGAMPLWEYRAKWYGEDEETARKMTGSEQNGNGDVIE